MKKKGDAAHCFYHRITYMAQNLRGTGSQYHAVQPKSTTIAYNALGQTTFLSRYQNVNLTGDNLRTVSVYDNDTHRLTTLSHRNIGSYSVLSNYAFQYDDMNRITQINHTAAVSAHADGISDFTYDKASQLTDAEHALPARPDENLQYDANGNRIGSGYQTATGNTKPKIFGSVRFVFDRDRLPGL